MNVAKQPMDGELRMSARYRLSIRDYYRVAWLASPGGGKAWVGLLYLFSFAVLVVGGAAIGSDLVIGVGAGIMLGLPLVMIPYASIFSLYSYYWRYRRNHNEFEVAVRDDGIRFTSSNGENRLEWSSLRKWRCDSDYVVIYVAPRRFLIVPCFVIVPCAVGLQGFDIEGLKAALTGHVGPPA